MNLKDAIANISTSHEKDTLNPLYTQWGEKLDADHVWEEYPRPQMRRSDYHMLNGRWDYCIVPVSSDDRAALCAADSSVAHPRITPGTAFSPDGQILVPFSPESLLSGVERQLQPDEYLWYQRRIALAPAPGADYRCILHFDAVDQEAEVYCNGEHLASHLGGYLPFCAVLPSHLTDNDMPTGDTLTDNTTGAIPASSAPRELLLQVRVRDLSDTSWRTRGKQTLKRGGMFYTAQSGIWQSVWYEWVPKNAITSMKLTPDCETGTCRLQLYSTAPFTDIALTAADGTAYPQLRCQSNSCAANDTDGTASSQTVCTDLLFALPEGADIHLWSPNDPYLYDVVITADEDRVESYFAMRSFTLEPDENGCPVFCLNHKPLFLHGILDQGYWPDGLMTAPCDEAFLYDIKLVKSFGFNMIRKHIKIEPLRWYYHCDRLGVIVWQDMVNGGSTYHMSYICYFPTLFANLCRKVTDNHYRLLARASEEGRREWLQECLGTVSHLYNVPSLAVWVPFNEAWGQFDAAKVSRMVQELDSTRLIDHASGWFDQKAGHFRSIHNYFRPLSVEPHKHRAFVISEYGGYACHIPGHSSVDRVFGYKRYRTCESLSEAYHSLIDGQLKPLVSKGLSGGVYTQLSDIEEEVNGLVTYDRRVVKITLPQ